MSAINDEASAAIKSYRHARVPLVILCEVAESKLKSQSNGSSCDHLKS
jgi:hypothetical protein